MYYKFSQRKCVKEVGRFAMLTVEVAVLSKQHKVVALDMSFQEKTIPTPKGGPWKFQGPGKGRYLKANLFQR